MAFIFWDKVGVIFTDYMQQGKSMTGDYYCSFQTKLQTKIVETRREKSCVVFARRCTCKNLMKSVLKLLSIQHGPFELLPIFKLRKSPERMKICIKKDGDRCYSL
jgi:hypothetical protein